MIETLPHGNSTEQGERLSRSSKNLLVLALAPLFFVGSFFFVHTVQAQTPPADPAPPTTTPTPTTRTMTGSRSECEQHSSCVCTSATGLGAARADLSPTVTCTWTETDGTEVSRDVNVLTGRGNESRTNPDGTYSNTPVNPPAKTCSAWDVAACIRSLPGMIIVGVAFFFLTLSGIILFVAGTVFNFVVLRTVFQFGTYFGTSEGMLIAWGVMRDIANIGLLFGFIFMGVLLILNVDSGGHGHGGGISAKKAIPKLIIFAVLLNFSLFASQAVIDVSNAFASSFATLAGEECDTTTTSGAGATGGTGLQSCANIGISGQILGAAGLTAIWDGGARDNDALIGNLFDRPYSYAVSLIMLAIFVLVTALVLLAGSIMLIIRVVVLSLLMVTSPIGFAGMAIPKLQGMASMWWSKLMSQAFFAPVYLLLIFISIKLTEGLMDGEATLANAMIGNQGTSVAGNMQVVMVFLIVIGFMIGSLMAATKMGAMGAKFATSAAGGMTLGAAGFVGRRTVGRASNWAGERIRMSSIRNTEFGRGLAGIADYGAKSSFSLRTVANKGLGKTGIDVGTANKTASHGYHGIEEKAVKEREDYAKSLVGRDKTASELEEQARAAQNVQISENLQRAAEAERDAKKARMDSQSRVLSDLKKQAEERAARGEKPDPVLTQRIKDEEAALKDNKEYQIAARGYRESEATVSTAKAQVERTKAVQETTNERIETATSKKGAQNEYAKHLEDKAHKGRTFFVSQRANHHAADKIKTEANKSKEIKALEQMVKDAAEKNKKPEAAPKTAPTAGASPPAHNH